MGDLIPLPAANTVGVLTIPEPERIQDYEKRLRDAAELERKLQKVNEQVPTRVYNVAGSCAGAGSGSFHHYRQIRRAEQNRLRQMDEEDARERQLREHEEKLKQRQEAAEQRTAKNRGKRQKRKEKARAQKRAKAGGGDAADADAEAGGGGDNSSGGGDSSDAPEQPDLD